MKLEQSFFEFSNVNEIRCNVFLTFLLLCTKGNSGRLFEHYAMQQAISSASVVQSVGISTILLTIISEAKSLSISFRARLEKNQHISIDLNAYFNFGGFF